jgi:hypothetical protein
MGEKWLADENFFDKNPTIEMRLFGLKNCFEGEFLKTKPCSPPTF